ncbi:MAG: PAAR domain-containing protein [Pseudomonadota bacterium]|nr:PAAR domain-containing protein [Pseudomonadota bacterium]
MKDSAGRGVVRLGDKTSHGGQVISASATFIVLDKQVALHGDTTFCPKCKGTFPIQVATSERRHHNQPVAYHGDATACGAKLISSI